jgi:ribosomal protein S18 acetylase RimI-like enzyme
MTTRTVRSLAADEVRSLAPALAEILVNCVAGGASVSFMAPFSESDALAYWAKVADAVALGATGLIVGAVDGAAQGTVQIAYDTPPNQPHRADIRKLLVHRRVRRQGLGRMLMLAAEKEAVARGRSLLCLDTASGAAERLYAGLGWQRVGVIPDYALWPRGGFCDTTIFYKRLS